MRIPKSLNKNPIVEAIIEVRFTASVPTEVVFGLVYKQIQDIFPKIKDLPLQGVPKQVRENDINLRYAPLYSLQNEDYKLNIGSKVISLIVNNYSGWHDFSELATTVFNKIDNLDIIDQVERLGLRYVNFIEGDVYSKLELNLKTPFDDKLTATNISLNHDAGNIKSKVTIANNVLLNYAENRLNGSIIDIDSFIEQKFNFFGNIKKSLNSVHDVEKKIFFQLLKCSFIDELGPKYD